MELPSPTPRLSISTGPTKIHPLEVQSGTKLRLHIERIPTTSTMILDISRAIDIANEILHGLFPTSYDPASYAEAFARCRSVALVVVCVRTFFELESAVLEEDIRRETRDAAQTREWAQAQAQSQAQAQASYVPKELSPLEVAPNSKDPYSGEDPKNLRDVWELEAREMRRATSRRASSRSGSVRKESQGVEAKQAKQTLEPECEGHYRKARRPSSTREANEVDIVFSHDDSPSCLSYLGPQHTPISATRARSPSPGPKSPKRGSFPLRTTFTGLLSPPTR